MKERDEVRCYFRKTKEKSVQPYDTNTYSNIRTFKVKKGLVFMYMEGLTVFFSSMQKGDERCLDGKFLNPECTQL